LRSPLTLTLLFALLALPGRRRSRQELAVLAFDLAMIAGAVMLALWYFIIGPAIVAGANDGVLELLGTSVAASDGMVACGAAFVITRGVAASVRGIGRLLGAAVMLLIAPDVAIAYTAVHHSAFDAVQPTLGLVGAGAYLLFLAARAAREAQGLPDGGTDPPQDGPTWMVEESSLPYLSVLLGFVLLVVAAVRSPLYPFHPDR